MECAEQILFSHTQTNTHVVAINHIIYYHLELLFILLQGLFLLSLRSEIHI